MGGEPSVKHPCVTKGADTKANLETMTLLATVIEKLERLNGSAIVKHHISVPDDCPKDCPEDTWWKEEDSVGEGDWCTGSYSATRKRKNKEKKKRFVAG